MILSADNQKVFNEALAASTEEINAFYKEGVYQTHYILFLAYLRLSRLLAELEGIDRDNKEMEKITAYVFERMPHREILANVMTPEYFPDASEIMRYMMMSPGDLEQEKQKLLNKSGLWSL